MMFWKRSPNAVLAGLMVIHLLAHIDRNMLLAFSPQIIADIGLNNAQYGFLAGAVWVLSFGGMAVFMGSLADRFSRTRVIAAGVLIWSLCTWASGHAESFEQLVVARFFVASGEAALVPAAVALLAELFSQERRSMAMGVFFMGIPLGVGCSFLLAGTFGASIGWRDTFYVLGAVGVAIAVLLAFLKEDRSQSLAHERGAPFLKQMTKVLGIMRENSTMRNIIVGFVLVHMVFAALSFTQLWLVKERGMDAATVATRIGLLQLAFGTLGSIAGGVLGDRVARRMSGAHASLMVLLVVLCGPAMIAARFASPDSLVLYVGLCAGFFLPLALYASVNAATMSMVPENTRATVTGFTMLCINVFAIAIGNLGSGWAVDVLGARGVSAPLTKVLLATDILAISSVLFFACAARAASKATIAGATVQPTTQS
ncbi:MFS transporter [Cupriavidus basilensis]|uniref:MFS transporter n=1 Tax=Cupriavidus sp. TaxID=1873897 RepID=UPI003D14B95C